MRCFHYTDFRQRNLPTVFAIFARFLSMCPHKRFMRGRRKPRQKPPPIKKAVRRTSVFSAPLPKGSRSMRFLWQRVRPFSHSLCSKRTVFIGKGAAKRRRLEHERQDSAIRKAPHADCVSRHSVVKRICKRRFELFGWSNAQNPHKRRICGRAVIGLSASAAGRYYLSSGFSKTTNDTSVSLWRKFSSLGSTSTVCVFICEMTQPSSNNRLIRTRY